MTFDSLFCKLILNICSHVFLHSFKPFHLCPNCDWSSKAALLSQHVSLPLASHRPWIWVMNYRFQRHRRANSVAQLTHSHYHQWTQWISIRVSSLLYNLVIQALWLVCIEFRLETSLNGIRGARASSDHPVLLLLPHQPWPSEDAYYSLLICLS